MIEVKELYEQFCLKVPVKQYESDPADFRGLLKRVLEEYMWLIERMRGEHILTDDNEGDRGDSQCLALRSVRDKN